LSIRLRLSDPDYTERLASFLESVGRPTEIVEPGVLRLRDDVPGAEVGVYLRVWHVLHPDAVVTEE
jgi:hypothetical protein